MQGAALVTGAGRRIGRAIAVALAREGLDLAVHCNLSRADAESAAEEVRTLGRRCEVFQCDLADLDAVRDLAEGVFQRLPHWNVLVNNASVFDRRTFAETDEAFFDRTLAINLKAPFFLSRRFAAGCRQGHIINLLDAKIAGCLTSHFLYSLTKKALADFTELAAKALGPGVRVNGVCPGLILPAAGDSPESFRQMALRTPLKRCGSAGNVVEAVLSLLRNDFLTGQCLFVDGGQHLG